MPINSPRYGERETDPFDEEQIRRQALIQQLGQGQPEPPIVDRSTGPAPTGPIDIGPRPGADSTMPVPDPNVAPAPAPRGTGRDQRDQLQWGNTGTMRGFEVGSDYGGDTKARNSVKNTFGRIASRYANTSQGLQQLLQDEEFRQYFPNARLIEHASGDSDKIDFGGVLSDFESGSPVGVIDVLEALEGGNSTGWQWNDGGVGAGVGPTGGGGPMPTGGSGAIDALGNNDALAQIIAEINALSQGEESPEYRHALMQLLGGQV